MPRETLTREQLVEAAIAILDEDGYDALSMRHLAQRLGVAAPTLYWHVRNRDELLDLVADAIVGEVLAGFGAADDWRSTMSALARSLRDVLARHRGVASIVGLRPLAGPNALVALEQLMGALRRDGFTDDGAVLAATTLTGWASGFAVFEAHDRTGGTPPPGLPDPDARFAYGLTALLDGIEADLRRRADTDRPEGKRHKPDADRAQGKGKGKRHKRDADRPHGKQRSR